VNPIACSGGGGRPMCKVAAAKAGMSPSEARFFLAVFLVEARLDRAASGR
jgi:hypothetical protein